MIDFRYHLISLVAVLLALCVGVVVGSGMIGGPILQDLENRAERIREANQQWRDLAEERSMLLEEQERFAVEAEPRLIEGALTGEEIVVIEIEGSDGDAASALRTSLATAGGEVASTIRLQNKFALRDDVERDLLALAVASPSAEASDVRADAARRIGARVAAAVQGQTDRITSLIDQLEEGDFAASERSDEGGPLVPENALIVVVAGGPDEPEFDIGAFVTQLAATIGERDVPVIVTEPLLSEWNVVATLQGDGTARESVGTVSGIESAAGRAAAALTLAAARGGEVGHHGTGDGNELVLPQASPGPD